MSLKNPRGIRNNNPGNIEKRYKSDGSLVNKWQGRTDDPVNGQDAVDSRFETFVSPKWGIRALAVLLINYYDKHGIDTIESIIHRWAPPNENNTDAYVNAVVTSVTNKTGIPARESLDLHDYGTLKALIEAIVMHENGIQPYTDAQINAGMAAAGVIKEDSVMIVADDKTIKKRDRLQKTGIGANVVAASATVAAVTDFYESFQHAFMVGGGVLILVAICIGLYNYSETFREWLDAKLDKINL